MVMMMMIIVMVLMTTLMDIMYVRKSFVHKICQL